MNEYHSVLTALHRFVSGTAYEILGNSSAIPLFAFYGRFSRWTWVSGFLSGPLPARLGK